MQNYRSINAIRDLVAGSVAILAARALSDDGKVLFAWHQVNRTMRICALDLMLDRAKERSLDEVPPEGWHTEPCRDETREDHVHWMMDPGPLDAMVEMIEHEMRVDEMRKQIAGLFSRFNFKNTHDVDLDPDTVAAMYASSHDQDDAYVEPKFPFND